MSSFCCLNLKWREEVTQEISFRFLGDIQIEERCEIFMIIKTDYMSREVIKRFGIILFYSATLVFSHE